MQTTELNQGLVAQVISISGGCGAIRDAPAAGVELDEGVLGACLVS